MFFHSSHPLSRLSTPDRFLPLPYISEPLICTCICIFLSICFVLLCCIVCFFLFCLFGLVFCVCFFVGLFFSSLFLPTLHSLGDDADIVVG